MAFSASLSNGSETHFNAHWATLHCQVGFPLRPAAHIEQDLIYLRDGRLVTAAGVTAGIDLALALVGQQHGPDVALKVAKRLVVVAQRQGGQSQFSPYLTATADPASPIARTQDYVRSNLVGRHTLKFLAAEVGMSSRNLARHFVQEAGITPHEFVERARIDAARMLLEGSDPALKPVAHDCGFGTADRMRIVFSERLGVTPAQYRASFRRADASEPTWTPVREKISKIAQRVGYGFSRDLLGWALKQVFGNIVSPAQLCAPQRTTSFFRRRGPR